MQTRESIFAELRTILEELFEIPGHAITPEAHLYEELDLDSIDAIDLVAKLQDLTGKRVKPEDFKSARTVKDIVDSVYTLVQK